MPLNELLPAVSQLSDQDKLRLIHFYCKRLLEKMVVEPTDEQDRENLLLKQLASSGAVVWYRYEAYEAAETLSKLIKAAK